MDDPTERQNEYRLVRAKIAYQENDRPHLQRNIEWEDYDLAPDYPELKRFLEVFSNHLDGAIDVVRVYDTNYARPLDRIYAPTSASFH